MSAVYRRPFLQVLGPTDADLVQIAGSRLKGVKLIDRTDDVSDEAIFTFTRKPPYIAVPPVGTPFTVRLGWSARQVAITGYYTFQRLHLFGKPPQGELVQWICRAGDVVDHLKKVDSEHYDETNGHTTLGDIFRSLFPGQEVVIPDGIAGRKVDYFLRWNQSAIDAATSLANDNGAIVKPQGNKIVVLERGAGQSGSGKTLATVTVDKLECFEYDAELEPLFEFQSVSAAWFDSDKGMLDRQDKTTAFKTARDALPHPAPSKEEATAVAAAAAQEWGRFTGQGLFTVPGNAAAVADCPVKCINFGSPIDGVDWEAVTVEHDVVPEVGWHTTIETDVKAS